jgi:hypothetical protein
MLSKRRDLDGLQAELDVGKPEPAADDPAIAEQLLDLVRVRVGPDIEVENLPFESFNGRDRQLEAALDYLDQKLKAEPVLAPPTQKIPAPGTPASDAVKQ